MERQYIWFVSPRSLVCEWIIILKIGCSSALYRDVLWVPLVAFVNLALLLSERLFSSSFRQGGNKCFLAVSRVLTVSSVQVKYVWVSKYSIPYYLRNSTRQETDWIFRTDHGHWCHACTLLWVRSATLLYGPCIILCYARFDILAFPLQCTSWWLVSFRFHADTDARIWGCCM